MDIGANIFNLTTRQEAAVNILINVAKRIKVKEKANNVKNGTNNKVKDESGK